MGASEDLMDGLDEELAIPEEWIEKAKQEEGALRVRWNNQDDEFEPMWQMFVARYPFMAEKEFLYATGPEASTQRAWPTPRVRSSWTSPTPSAANMPFGPRSTGWKISAICRR